jgi:nitrite reductase (NADH) large subunit
LGLEAADGLVARGMTVTVVHLMPTVMERQLDASAGVLLKRELEDRGLRILTAADTLAIVGDGKVEAVRLRDGRAIPADIVVMAVGIRPNADLARGAGLAVERGVVVDDRMVTSHPHVLAVGECVQHRGQTYGLVAPLYEMAEVAADTLAGRADSLYAPSVTSTKLKVTGLDLFSAGDFLGGADCDDIVFRDPARGVYKRIVLKENRVAGAVLYGDTADGAWLFRLMRERSDISEWRETLIFGPFFQDGSSGPAPVAAALMSSPEPGSSEDACSAGSPSAVAQVRLEGARAAPVAHA